MDPANADRRWLALLRHRRRNLPKWPVSWRQRHAPKPDRGGFHRERAQATAPPCPRAGSLPRAAEGLQGREDRGEGKQAPAPPA